MNSNMNIQLGAYSVITVIGMDYRKYYKPIGYKIGM